MDQENSVLNMDYEYAPIDFNGTSGPCGYLGNGSNSSNPNLTCAELQEEYLNPFDIAYIKGLFIVLYSLVFACCFLGNILVIFVVLRHRKMRTITNFFLANLAVADLCVGIFCVLPNLSLNISPQWILGRVMCKLYYFVQTMSYTASVIILTVISVERYFAIIHPMRSKQLTTLCLLRTVVVIVWLISAGCGIPYLVAYDIMQIPMGMSFCLALNQFDARTHATVYFIVCYLLPLALMTGMYSKISVVLWKSSKMGHMEKKISVKFENKNKTAKNGAKSPGKRTTLMLLKKKDSDNRCFYKPVARFTSVEESNDGTCSDSSCQSLKMTIANPKVTEEIEKETRPHESEGEETSEGEVDYEDDWPQSGKYHAATSQTSSAASYVFQNNKAVRGDYEMSPLRGNKKTLNSIKGHPNKYNRVNTGNTQNKKPKSSGHRRDNALLARRKVIRLLIAVIISFAICVLPYHIRILWQLWSMPKLSFGERLLPPITFLIYYFNSGLNPILYAFLSDNFRKSLKEVTSCVPNRVRRQWSARSTTCGSMKTIHSQV